MPAAKAAELRRTCTRGGAGGVNAPSTIGGRHGGK